MLYSLARGRSPIRWFGSQAPGTRLHASGRERAEGSCAAALAIYRAGRGPHSGGLDSRDDRYYRHPGGGLPLLPQCGSDYPDAASYNTG